MFSVVEESVIDVMIKCNLYVYILSKNRFYVINVVSKSFARSLQFYCFCCRQVPMQDIDVVLIVYILSLCQ